MSDGLSRGVLETLLVLVGVLLLVLDAFGVVTGFAAGSLLIGLGGFSVGTRVNAPKVPDDDGKKP